MTKIRELVNTAILNSGEWVGFQGDSEFIDDNGKLHLGYWNFIGTDPQKQTNINLDTTIDTSQDYCEVNGIYEVMNDNGLCCKIRIMYYGDEDGF